MKLGWRGALGILLSAGLLWWAFKDVPIAEVREQLGRSNVGYFILSAIVATTIFPLRAIRWRVILDPIAPGLPFGQLWRATAIGMMVNNVAPARAGEFARAFALTRETNRVGFVASVASLALDRVFDAVVLIMLLVGAMLMPAFPGATVIAGQPASRYAMLFAVGVLGLLAALFVMVFWPALILRVYDAIVGRILPKFADRGRGMLTSFISGLGALRSPRRFALVFFWTVIHWLVSALSFYIGFKAVGITAPFSAALFLQSLIAIGVALPSSPGFFGFFEASAKVGLAVYGVGEAQAVSWAIGFHVLSFLPITVIGAVYFARLGMHFRELGAEPATGR
jgi:glycosyltransferase 2 family protein